MSKALILQQVAHEGPGRIVTIFRDFGIPVEERKLFRGDEVPQELDDVRVLVVLGGPMGIGDVGGGRYPYLSPQVELLQRAIAADVPVLGICLGAQLIAHAAGAKVYPNAAPATDADRPPMPAPELGWGPVTFPFPGGTDPIVFGLSDGAPMFHWHFDTFDLPRLPAPPNPLPPAAPPPPTGSILLSSTRTCKNQAFRFKRHVYGFQYHFEFTPSDIEAVLANADQAVTNALAPDGLQRVRQQANEYYPRYERAGERIVRNFVQFLKVY